MLTTGEGDVTADVTATRPDNLLLGDQLCFALYAATNSITRAYRPLLQRIGLTYPQYLVLLVLWQEGERSVNQIAERLALAPHALSPLLERLETAGLVARQRSAPDRRVVRVRCTPGGAALEAAASEVQREVACATRLDPAALAALRDQLQDLTSAMSGAPIPTPAPTARPRCTTTVRKGSPSMTSTMPTDTARTIPVQAGDAAPAAQETASVGSLYERLGGIYGIAGAVDALADRLYDNASANRNPHVAAFHAMKGHAGFKFLVTAWSVEQTGGPRCYPGRDMLESHAHLYVSEFEFDIVATEIAATLFHVGVPQQEHKEFMDIINSYRAQVIGAPGDKVEDS